MHGTIMLLFATPLFFGFGNVIMPLLIGSPDVAFPRLNIFRYWLFLFGSLIAPSGFLARQGAPDSGWTAYTPLSDAERSPGVGDDRLIMGLWWRPRHHSGCGILRHHSQLYACAGHDHVPDAELRLEHL
ncbi:MAG: Cytochrome-c oxidase [Nocardioides sp.]|nr:Cytochrome-c oxidase [Nocardioides sp.]